jgi:hypothetical protein
VKSELFINTYLVTWANEFTSSVDGQDCLITQIRDHGIIALVINNKNIFYNNVLFKADVPP